MTKSDEEDGEGGMQRIYIRKQVNPTAQRLIPELSPQQKLDQHVKDQISQHLNQKRGKTKIEWDPERGQVVALNGGDKSFAPYKVKSATGEKGINFQQAKVVHHNGRTIVYSYGKPTRTETQQKRAEQRKIIMGSIDGSLTTRIEPETKQTGNVVWLGYSTVKHFLFARTLFLRKFARAWRRENKVLANNLLCKDYRRINSKSQK